ncbi:MAG TPA: hypothetical protein VNW49_15950, partial [Puia sp.]|nr:hypothetical protein [Puia sp.]
MTISKSVRKVVRRIFGITITTVLVLLGIILLILLLIQTGPVQNYGRGKLEAYLENKLHTKVRIGNLYIGFPSRIILKNIYLEDRRKDTLLSGGKIQVDISMLRLFSRELRINYLELDDITMKVKRQLPDSVFNFQFIADAFSSPPDTTLQKKNDSGGFHFIIGSIHLQNVHASYGDDATGNDVVVNLGVFNTKLKTFDPEHQVYAIPDISLADISGKIRQYKPILILHHIADTISEHNKNSGPVKLELGNIDFTHINMDYRNEIENMDAGIRLGHYQSKVDSINLSTFHIKLKEITLNNTMAVVRFGKLNKIKTKKTAAEEPLNHSGNWSVDVAGISIDSTHLQYDDDNQVPIKKGMDYSHLNLKRFRLKVSKLHADPSNIGGLISGFSFDEKSGFVLKNLSAGISFDSTGASLKNLVLKTNYSDIRNQSSIHYQSLEELKKHPGNLETNLEFDRSRIAIQDLLIFVPSLEGMLKDYSQATLLLNGKLTGYLKNLKILYLEIDGLGNTSLAASGQIRGLPDGKKAVYNITISKFTTSLKDIHRMIPANSIPDNLRIPESITANGKFSGTIKSFFVQLHTTTSNGMADISGTLDLDRKTYDLKAGTKSLDLGYILKQDSLFGKITLDATAKGSGFDPKNMNSVYHVHLGDAVIKSYEYRGLILDAQLQNGNGRITSSMQDPNITYQLKAEANFQGKYPSIRMDLNLDTLNALALNLLRDSLQMHLKLNADFRSTDPDALQGKMSINDLRLTYGMHPLHTDSISLVALHSDTGQTISLRSEAADIDWRGRYKLTQVAESMKQFINTYYKIPVSNTDSTEPEQWKMDLELRPSPLVLAIMPSLKGSDSLKGNIRFNSLKKDLSLDLHTDKIQLNQLVIHQVRVAAYTKNQGLDYNISIDDAGQSEFQLYKTDLYGTLANNKLTIALRLKDKKVKDKYFLSGTASTVNHGIRYIFNPDSLLLDYQRWQLPSDNFIQYDSAGIIARNLKFNHLTESVELNTHGETSLSPL